MSGRRDSNPGPLAPKASALAGLRYAPIWILYQPFPGQSGLSIIREMKSRQAFKRTATLLILLVSITACSTANQPLPTPTFFSPIPTYTPTIIPPEEPTVTPQNCLTKPGTIESGKVESTNPAQEYLIYLPPCYDEKTDQKYPVLYLLHGQTYTDNQWIRLGAADALDQLIASGETQPFIIVFPDDRYWNLAAGPGFGDRLVNALIPYIDQNYRTKADRYHRAIGGMSRGAGWALQLGLSHWDLFSVIGLHSLAVFKQDASRVEKWLKAMPKRYQPTIYMDIGDNDPEFADAQEVETEFNHAGIPHEWHLYKGAHTEEYWQAHTMEYIEWYAEQWNSP